MVSAISQIFPVSNTEVTFWTDEYGESHIQAKCTFEALDLGVTNISTTLERHIFPEYRRKVAIGVGQPAWYLTYEGVVQLVMVTNSPKAREFQRWVFAVIKSIIKTGTYTATEQDQQHFQPFGLKINLQTAVDRLEDAIAEKDLPSVQTYTKALLVLDKLQSKQEKQETNKQIDTPVPLETELNWLYSYLTKKRKPVSLRDLGKTGRYQGKKRSAEIKSLCEHLISLGKLKKVEEGYIATA